MRPMKLHGQTWYQWASDLFRYENCAECHKGVRGHEPAILMGNWFAHCKESEEVQNGED
jgi:hypothetical protein